MDVQTIEQRLRDLNRLRNEVSALEGHLHRLQSAATGSRVELREGPGGGSYQTDKTGAQVAHMERIAALIAVRRPELDMLTEWATNAFQALDRLPQDVMTLRFLDGLTVVHIAEMLHYTERYIFRIQGDAIKQMGAA